MLENQIRDQNYTAAKLETFLLNKLIIQQILDKAQQQKQDQNNDNNIA